MFWLKLLGLGTVLTLLTPSSYALTTPDEKEYLGRLIRHEAIYGYTKRIEKLIGDGGDVNSTGEFGETALYYAVQFGHLKTALRLIELGANPSIETDMGRTAFLKAAEDCNYRVVEASLKRGADINHQDIFGKTALINAVQSNCVRATAVLLLAGKKSLKLDHQDGAFRTAEDYAEHPWIVEMLKLARLPASVPNDILIQAQKLP